MLTNIAVLRDRLNKLLVVTQCDRGSGFQLTSLEWKLNDCKELRRGEHNDYKDNDYYYYYYASFLSRPFFSQVK